MIETIESPYIHAANSDNFKMLKLFNVVGTDNPLVSKFRSNLKRYAH